MSPRLVSPVTLLIDIPPRPVSRRQSVPCLVPTLAINPLALVLAPSVIRQLQNALFICFRASVLLRANVTIPSSISLIRNV